MSIISNKMHGVKLISPHLQFSGLILPTLFLCCIFYSALSQAHDPGLSIIDMQFTDNGLAINIKYARKELQQILALDSDRDGQISTQEISQQEEKLQFYISRSLKFILDNRALQTNHITVQLDTSDALDFRLFYPDETGQHLQINSSGLDRLALGHRQFVSIKKAGKPLTSVILSAQNQRASINLPAPNLIMVFFNYLQEGVWHIWIGFDHILFIISLLLPAALMHRLQGWVANNNAKAVFIDTFKVISAFTLAHSLTLILTIFNVLRFPDQIIESVIAISVIVAALNNIFIWVKEKLWLLAGLFGLIHGMGFASVLSDLGLPVLSKSLALIAFNFGVELGQLAIVALVLPIIYVLRHQSFYHTRLLKNGSWCIALIASVWLIERITQFPKLGWL